MKPVLVDMLKEKKDFDQSIALATSIDAVWKALEDLSLSSDGHRLFTVMTVDMAAGLARRVYSNHPSQYPVTGTKPIHRDSWFEIVHGQRRSFVANTITDIAKVFLDYELIQSLGCASVINLPVVLQDELVATINLLHGEGHYSPQRVAELEVALSLPAKMCCALAALIDAAAHD
jgi:hypothetical protein